MKNKEGMSLIEVVTAVSIFAIIIVIAIDSFLSVIRINRDSRQYQAVQDHTRFLYQMMAKELRMARVVDDTTCASFSGQNLKNKVYTKHKDSNNNDVILFKNYHGDCVKYYMKDDNSDGNYELWIDRYDVVNNNLKTGIMMPRDIKINSLYFDVTNLDLASATNDPPSVMFYMELESSIWNPASVKLQTTITSRYIE